VDLSLVLAQGNIRRKYWSFAGGRRNKGRRERVRVEGWNGGFDLSAFRGLAVLIN